MSPEVPTRIIAEAYAAKALMEFGIEPVGIWASSPIGEDVGLRGADFSGIEILGEEWGKIDVAAAAAELQPDLIVGDWWPVEEAYSGFEDGVEEESKKLADLAPVVGSAQSDSIVDLIEGYADLAASLGADTGTIDAARAEFDAAVADFQAATTEKPGLTALAISPSGANYAIAVPAYAPELLDFQSWGLNVINPETPDPDFPYWETLSVENADKYQPDLILFDDRWHPGNEEALAAAPISSTPTRSKSCGCGRSARLRAGTSLSCNRSCRSWWSASSRRCSRACSSRTPRGSPRARTTGGSSRIRRCSGRCWCWARTSSAAHPPRRGGAGRGRHRRPRRSRVRPARPLPTPCGALR